MHTRLSGIGIALLLISIWAISLVILLSRSLSWLHPLGILLAILWQTFLSTGLFITAHDAMHGLVYPHNRSINDRVGTLVALLYALFPYKKLLHNHQLHHRYPATHNDPDYYEGGHETPLAWYVHFIKTYFRWRQLFKLIGVILVAILVLQVHVTNLVLFWIVPLILSSAQLFYFGTFLPHRKPKDGYTNQHHAQSLRLPWVLSLITCYHFSYHQEHHQFPHVPWWQLPTYRIQD